jgi:hypothetical protein
MHYRTILLDLFGPGTWGAGGNLVAWVICGALGAAGTYLLRHRLRAWWAAHHPHSAALAEIRQIAEAAHRIAADTHEHVTGSRHPDSPGARTP